MSDTNHPTSIRVAEDRQELRGVANILVPLDGSALAERVLPASVYLAERLDATLTLLHVVERHAPDTVHGESHLQDADTAYTYLEDVAARFGGPNRRIDIHVHPNPAGDVAHEIADHVSDLHAELVVLAAHGRGGVRDVLVGRTAQRVLRQTETPILMIQPTTPANDAAFACRRMLVLLDGHPAAERVLPLVRLLLSATGAQLQLVRVVPTPGTETGDAAASGLFLPSATAAVLDLEAERALDYLNEVKDRELHGLEVTVDVRRGDAVAGIDQALAEAPADLVVLATHGRSGIVGHLTGSVATRLLERITQPILLIRVRIDDGGE